MMVRKIKKRAVMFLGLTVLGLISALQNLPFLRKTVLHETDLTKLITEVAYADVPDNGSSDAGGPTGGPDTPDCPDAGGPCAGY